MKKGYILTLETRCSYESFSRLFDSWFIEKKPGSLQAIREIIKKFIPDQTIHALYSLRSNKYFDFEPNQNDFETYRNDFNPDTDFLDETGFSLEEALYIDGKFYVEYPRYGILPKII